MLFRSQASGGERFTVKQLERTRKSLEARLEKLQAEGRKDTCSSCAEDGQSKSKRLEVKKLIAELKKANPFVEGNIFKSVENVNLSTIVAYKQNGVRHHFLDTYDDAAGNAGSSEE